VNGPWKAHSALPQQDVASGRPGWSWSGQGLPAGPAPRGRVLLVTFLARARKVTRPPAQAPVQRNKRQGGRKPPSTAVPRCLKTRLWAVSPASSAEARDRPPPWGRPGRACGSRVNGPWKAHSALPQQDVASGRPGWSWPGSARRAGPAGLPFLWWLSLGKQRKSLPACTSACSKQQVSKRAKSTFNGRSRGPWDTYSCVVKYLIIRRPTRPLHKCSLSPRPL